MKQLIDYITQENILEKLTINNDSKISKLYTFKHIPRNQREMMWGINDGILNDEYYDLAIPLLTWTLENCALNDKERNFITKFLNNLDDRITSKKIQKILLNGQKDNGLYQKPKCLYDICELILNNSNIFLKDKTGTEIKPKRLEELIDSLNASTNGKIKNLDWPH